MTAPPDAFQTRAVETSRDNDAGAEGPTPPRPGMVLVVDDEPLIADVIHSMFVRRDDAALVANSPAEALRLASRYPIRLLVTDYQMPGTSGVELAEQVRRLHGGIPVILCSAYAEAPTMAVAPPAAFLRKPFTIWDFDAAVEQVSATPD